MKTSLQTPTFKFALREDLQDTGDLFLPTKAEELSSGWDVKAAQKNRKDLIIKPGEYFKIPLGFRAIPEDGWWYQLHPRSSSFAKKHMHCLIGTIDESYEGELLLAGQHIVDSKELLTTDCVLRIKFGDAVAQIIPVKRQEMNVEKISNDVYDHLSNQRGALRKAGGFGSTS